MALPCSQAFTVSLVGGRGSLRAEWGSSAVALPHLAPVLPSAGSTWHCWNCHHDQPHGIPLCWHVCSSGVDSEVSQAFAGSSQGAPGAGACATAWRKSSHCSPDSAWGMAEHAGQADTACGLTQARLCWRQHGAWRQ